MQNRNKSYVSELFSHTAIYGVGLLLNKAVSFLLLPVYTYYYSPAQLGLFNLIQSLWLFIIVFYLYGMETSFIKYFIDAKDDKSRSEIYSSTLLLIISSSIILSTVLYFFSGSIASIFNFENPEKGKYLIKVLSLLLAADTIFRFPLLLLRAELKAQKYFYLNLLSVFLNISFNIIFIVIYNFDVEAILYSYIISVVITFVAGLIITKKYFQFGFSAKRIKELAVYGNKFIYIGFFILFIDTSDRFFLKYFGNESIVGIYSASYRLASVMGLIITAFKFSWTPYFLNLSKNPENKKIISNIFTYFVFTGLLLFFIFSFFTEPVVKYKIFNISILNADYQEGLKIIPIVLMSYFFSGLYSNMTVAPFYENKTRHLLSVAFAGFIINIIANFILIPEFGMMGAAYSTLITYFAVFVLAYFVSQKIYKINYERKKILIIAIIAIIVYAVSISFKNYINLPGKIIIIINLVLLMGYVIAANSLKIIDITRLNDIIFSRNIK